jgi:hypothetical protein
MKIRVIDSKPRKRPKIGQTRMCGGVKQVRQLRRDQHGNIVCANGRFCYEWVPA